MNPNLARTILCERHQRMLGIPQHYAVFNVQTSKLLPIPFTENQLIGIRDGGADLLVIQPGSLSIASMIQNRRNLIPETEQRLCSFNPERFAGENFFTENLPTGWALVGADVVPRSIGRNALGRTAALVERAKGIREIFGDQGVGSDLDSQNAERGSSDPVLGPKLEMARLMNLPVNVRFCPTAGQVFYFAVLYRALFRKWPFSGHMVATRSTDSDGFQVVCGPFSDKRGIGLSFVDPQGHGETLGACYSFTPAIPTAS